MPGQQYFLLAKLYPTATGAERQGDEASGLTGHYRSAEDHHQEPGINRMANQAIRTGLNQFMLLFQGNPGTPVSAQRCPRPNGDKKADQHECVADDSGGECVMKQDSIPMDYPRASIEQGCSQSNQEQVKQPVCEWLMGFCLFD